MKTFVCIAGLPKGVVEEIQRRSAKRFTGDATNPPIAFPVREPYGYREGMSDAYLGELSRRLRKVPHSQDAAILLAYVDYGDHETKCFVENFRPFALAAPIKPFYPDQAPKTERRSNLVHFVDGIAGIVDGVKERVRIVRDILSGRNFSPLLLPVRNFQSSVVRSSIYRLFEELGTASDPRAVLGDATKAMLARHPVRRLEEPRNDRTRFFEDDRLLRFKSPGRNRHGMARSVGDGHRLSCFLGSRVRLGAPFDPLFHYDCEYERSGLDRYYPNCHGTDIAPAAATHVNIAPSDAVR